MSLVAFIISYQTTYIDSCLSALNASSG